MSQKQSVLLLSGYNIRAVIAFCRWATAHNVNFHIIARDEHDPIFLTDYKKNVLLVRDSLALQPGTLLTWVETLNEKHRYDRVLLLPVSEYFNRFLLQHREEIEGNRCVIPLVEETLYKTISDKERFARLCASYGLDIPFEFDDIPAQFPFVAKPRHYFSVTGRQLIPYLIYDEVGLDHFLEKEEASEFFYQEFVKGRSIYLLAYLAKDGSELLFSQENLMQQAGGKSIILARHSDFHTTKLAQRYIDMLRAVGFSGLIMIELRYDEPNNRYVMIEANPRLWGPMQFVVDNDVDLFGRMLIDYGFIFSDPDKKPLPTSHYFWSGGISGDAQPIAFFNYSASQFFEEYPMLRSQDIFFRNDTLNLFLSEAGMRNNDET